MTFRTNKRNQEYVDVLHIPELESSIEDGLKKLYLLRNTMEMKRAHVLMRLQSDHIWQLKEIGLIWDFSFLEISANDVPISTIARG